MVERNAFVVSGTDILNFNPEVHMQHVAENVGHSVWAVVTLNTFHVMEMITTVPFGGKSINSSAKQYHVFARFWSC